MSEYVTVSKSKYLKTRCL